MRRKPLRKPKDFHTDEAVRIQQELDCLGNEYAEDNIIRFVLQGRIDQEKRRSETGCDDGYCSCR